MNPALNPTVRPVQLAAGVVLWGAALWASTRLHTLDLPIGRGVCGPWGCAAEPEALLGYHALWACLLIPGVALVCRAFAGPVGVRVAVACSVLGVLGFVGLFAGGALTWLSSHGSEYAIQRGLFLVATTTDLPVLQLTVAGLVGRLVGGSENPNDPNEASDSEP